MHRTRFAERFQNRNCTIFLNGDTPRARVLRRLFVLLKKVRIEVPIRNGVKIAKSDKRVDSGVHPAASPEKRDGM